MQWLESALWLYRIMLPRLHLSKPSPPSPLPATPSLPAIPAVLSLYTQVYFLPCYMRHHALISFTIALQRFLHFRHHHRRQRSRFADQSEFRRVASRDLPDGVLSDEYETMSAPATATANEHHRSASEDLQHVPTSQQLPASPTPPTPPPRSARTLRNSPTRAAVRQDHV